MPIAREPLIPLLVDAMGRSGTTVMMQLLASSPEVIAEREYPYESRYLTYLYSWAGMLDGDTKAAGKWPRDKMLPGQIDEIGGLPWRGLLSDSPGFARSCFRSAWEHFSSATEGNGTHYIEKVPRWISDAIPAALPATRVIHLVRDPRDVWLSIGSFNEKRGFPSFGRKPGQGEDEFLSQFFNTFRDRYEPLVGRDFGEARLLVRYEDLVSDPGAVAARLGAWTGLRFDPAATRVRTAEHLTSSSAAGSVDRWRRELPRGTRRRFESELGDLLAAFGYK